MKTIYVMQFNKGVGRFTVGSELVIDGKNSDGKDQHDQQCSDN